MPPSVLNNAAVFTLRDPEGTKVVCVKVLREGAVDSETPVLVYRLDEEEQLWTHDIEPMHVQVEQPYRVLFSLIRHPFLNDIVVEFDFESNKWVSLYDARSNGIFFHLAHIDASKGDNNMVTVYTQTLDKSLTFAHVYA